MDPYVLAWVLTRPAGDRWRGLSDAFSSGTTRVAFDGCTLGTVRSTRPPSLGAARR